MKVTTTVLDKLEINCKNEILEALADVFEADLMDASEEGKRRILCRGTNWHR